MKCSASLLALALAACQPLGVPLEQDSDPGDTGRPDSDAEQGALFTLQIASEAWERWGFRYPATYVFDLPDAAALPTVWHRDGDAWEQLQVRSAEELFNGEECVRFSSEGDKAYVSVAFEQAEVVELWFEDQRGVSFEGVSPLYDGRGAAYTLSNDNWGKNESDGHDGAPWAGMTDDTSDKYQASIHALRSLGIPVSIAINCNLDAAAEEAKWQNMQDELDLADRSWEPAVHSRTHPCSSSGYAQNGYEWEITGARDDILEQLSGIPFGQHVFEFILPCGYQDDEVQQASAGEFLFLRDWDSADHISSADTIYADWNDTYDYYGIGGFQTASYDSVFEARAPAGRYYEQDVAQLNEAFDTVLERGGIFYAMFHSDRYENSVIYSQDEGIDGIQGSSLMQHLAHVAGRSEVWYVANGWLYAYRYVAERVVVEEH